MHCPEIFSFLDITEDLDYRTLFSTEFSANTCTIPARVRLTLHDCGPGRRPAPTRRQVRRATRVGPLYAPIRGGQARHGLERGLGTLAPRSPDELVVQLEVRAESHRSSKRFTLRETN